MNNRSHDYLVDPASHPIHLRASLVGVGVCKRFQHIQSVLAPVIGHAEVVGLYERSRHISSRSYPWLAPSSEGVGSGMNLEDLKYLVSQQEDEEAAAGAGFLLKSFHELLSGLMGESLTLQILGSPPTLEPLPDRTR